MNKDVNKRKAGLIMWAESGDEIHWMVVTPEFYQKIKDLIESVPHEKWTNEVDWKMFQNVSDLLFSNEPIEKGFTQTWCRESAWMNKYEFIGMLTVPMY